MATKALARNGAAKVYIIGRRKDVLDEVAKSFPGVVVPIPGDITSKDFLWSAAEQIQSDMGYVNVVIANAGIDGAKTKAVKPEMSISEIRQQLWTPSTEEFTEAFSVNTVGVYYTFVAFLELLEAGNQKRNVEQQSQFIATTSVSAYNRKPMSSVSYCLSKAATTQLLKALSTNMAPHEIRANILCPGCMYIHFQSLSKLTVFYKYIHPTLQQLHSPGRMALEKGLSQRILSQPRELGQRKILLELFFF